MGPPLPNGTYSIFVEGNARLLSQEDDNNPRVYTDDHDRHQGRQQWILEHVQGDFYTITNDRTKRQLSAHHRHGQMWSEQRNGKRNTAYTFAFRRVNAGMENYHIKYDGHNLGDRSHLENHLFAHGRDVGLGKTGPIQTQWYVRRRQHMYGDVTIPHGIYTIESKHWPGNYLGAKPDGWTSFEKGVLETMATHWELIPTSGTEFYLKNMARFRGGDDFLTTHGNPDTTDKLQIHGKHIKGSKWRSYEQRGFGNINEKFIIFRRSDLGWDKPNAFLATTHSENPALKAWNFRNGEQRTPPRLHQNRHAFILREADWQGCCLNTSNDVACGTDILTPQSAWCDTRAIKYCAEHPDDQEFCACFPGHSAAPQLVQDTMGFTPFCHDVNCINGGYVTQQMSTTRPGNCGTITVCGINASAGKSIEFVDVQINCGNNGPVDVAAPRPDPGQDPVSRSVITSVAGRPEPGAATPDAVAAPPAAVPGAVVDAELEVDRATQAVATADKALVEADDGQAVAAATLAQAATPTEVAEASAAVAQAQERVRAAELTQEESRVAQNEADARAARAARDAAAAAQARAEQDRQQAADRERAAATEAQRVEAAARRAAADRQAEDAARAVAAAETRAQLAATEAAAVRENIAQQAARRAREDDERAAALQAAADRERAAATTRQEVSAAAERAAEARRAQAQAAATREAAHAAAERARATRAAADSFAATQGAARPAAVPAAVPAAAQPVPEPARIVREPRAPATVAAKPVEEKKKLPKNALIGAGVGLLVLVIVVVMMMRRRR